MSKQDLLKIQTCVLKVNIHCDGCEQKVKKLLQKIDGVYSVKVDANEGKVVVAGDVDPAKLVKKLKRAGKHAEIWGGGQNKGMKYNQNYPINPQFQSLQIDNGKGGKDKSNKSQNQKGHKGSGAGGGQGQQQQQLAQFQNIKGVQDLKVPAKDHNPKSVKFNLPEEEFDASDDDDFDEYEDNFDDYDDDDDEEEEEERLGHGHGTSHGHPMHHNKMMPMMGDGRGPHGPPAMMNGPAIINHKDNVGGSRNNNNGSIKKGDVIDQAMLMKGKGGNFNDAKNDNNGGKKSDQKGENLNKKGNKPKGGGEGGDGIKKKSGKSDNGLLGRFLGFGKKKNKKVEFEDVTYTKKSKNQKSVGGDNKGKEGKKGEGKLEDHIKNNSKHDFDFDDFDDYDDNTPPHHKNGKVGKGSNSGKEGQKGPSPIVGNYPMGRQMESIPTVQGLPTMNGGGGGGYSQGMQMPHAPYNNNNNLQQQQQQYMAMMMNQQGNMNNNMYPNAMMYGRPYPYMNYMPPPPMPSHPMADPITHTFSDENVESCTIM